MNLTVDQVLNALTTFQEKLVAMLIEAGKKQDARTVASVGVLNLFNVWRIFFRGKKGRGGG